MSPRIGAITIFCTLLYGCTFFQIKKEIRTLPIPTKGSMDWKIEHRLKYEGEPTGLKILAWDQTQEILLGKYTCVLSPKSVFVVLKKENRKTIVQDLVLDDVEYFGIDSLLDCKSIKILFSCKSELQFDPQQVYAIKRPGEIKVTNIRSEDFKKRRSQTITSKDGAPALRVYGYDPDGKNIFPSITEGVLEVASGDTIFLSEDLDSENVRLTCL